MKSVFVFAACLLAASLSAQSEIDTTITLSDHTGKSSISIDVPEGAEALAVVVEGLVQSGSIEIELFDPKGQRQSGFQLNSLSEDYLIVRHGDHDDRSATVKSKSKPKTKSKSSNSNSNSNKDSNSDEETLISVRSGGKTTSIASGEGSVSVSSGNSSIAISSNDGVSKVVTKGLGSNGGAAKGVMVETIDNPGAGRWELRIQSENVSGEINLDVDHD